MRDKSTDYSSYPTLAPISNGASASDGSGQERKSISVTSGQAPEKEATHQQEKPAVRENKPTADSKSGGTTDGCCGCLFLPFVIAYFFRYVLLFILILTVIMLILGVPVDIFGTTIELW